MSKLELLIRTIDEKFKTVDKEKLSIAEKSLTLSVEELISFQNLKSIAQMKGLIDVETAMFIYNALGEWERQTIGTKFVLTKLHADLLRQKLNGW